MNQAKEPVSPEQTLPMELDVKIHTIRTNGPVLATASVTLNNCFAVRGLKVMSGSNGPFVSMPGYKSGDKYRDICFPCTKEFHQEFHRAVINAYQQELNQLQSQQKNHESTGAVPAPLGENVPAEEGSIREEPAEGPSYGGMVMG